jgi:hypothetical protein
MLPEQTFEGRRENLNQANKLTRTYSAIAARREIAALLRTMRTLVERR